MTELEKKQPGGLPKIKEIYSFLFSNWKNILKAGSVYYILLEAYSQVYKIELTTYAPKLSPFLAFFIDIGAFFLWILASILIPAIVGTLIFKCLFGERPWPASFFPFSFGKIERKYSLWLMFILSYIFLGMLGIMSVAVVGVYFYPTSLISSVMIGAMIVGIIISLWVIMRLNLIFPALVDNTSDTFFRSVKASFMAMKGYILRLIWVYLILAFPFMIINQGITATYTFIIFFLPKSLGISLLILSIILGGLVSLFMTAGMFYISFRFYQIRKEAFVQRLQAFKK